MYLCKKLTCNKGLMKKKKKVDNAKYVKDVAVRNFSLGIAAGSLNWYSPSGKQSGSLWYN